MNTTRTLRKATLILAVASMAVGTEVTLSPKAYAQNSGSCPDGYKSVPAARIYNVDSGQYFTRCPSDFLVTEVCCFPPVQ